MAKYDADSIKILEGLEAVRKRPGMYIGSTDKRGLHHLVWEIVDNCIDEIINGFGDTIKIRLNGDGSILLLIMDVEYRLGNIQVVNRLQRLFTLFYMLVESLKKETIKFLEDYMVLVHL